jgi:hypothetical protein
VTLSNDIQAPPHSSSSSLTRPHDAPQDHENPQGSCPATPGHTCHPHTIPTGLIWQGQQGRLRGSRGQAKRHPKVSHLLFSYPYFFDLIYFYMYRSMSTCSKTKATDLEETIMKKIVGSVPPHFYLSHTDSILCFNYLDLLQGPRRRPSRLKKLPPRF